MNEHICGIFVFGACDICKTERSMTDAEMKAEQSSYFLQRDAQLARERNILFPDPSEYDMPLHTWRQFSLAELQ